MKTIPGLQAGGGLRREDALVYRASLLNETNAFEITLRDKLNDFAHVRSKAGNSERCHDEHHTILQIWGAAQICTTKLAGGVE